MLTLQNHVAKIANFNPRAEKHGDENKLAGDIKFETCCARGVLDQFDPTLRPLLFRAPAVGEQPQLIDQGDGATALRVPKLAPLKWDEEFPGYKLVVHSGLGLVEPMEIADVALSGFTLEALEGGSVKVGFRASCHPDAEKSGALCELIQEEVEISLVPPSASPQQELDTEAAEA